MTLSHFLKLLELIQEPDAVELLLIQAKKELPPQDYSKACLAVFAHCSKKIATMNPLSSLDN